MKPFHMTFKPSECRCFIPLAILGILCLALLAVALVGGPLLL